ncbi:cytochrome c biogenesis CcdA family protein, partial [Candidatus Latescibacterota bacterium]
DFLERYGKHFTFVELDVSQKCVLDSLYAMESRVGVSEEDKDYPAVYFMGTMIEGAIPIGMRLESLVKSYLANPDSMTVVDREVMSRIPEQVKPEISESAKIVSLAYFYKHGCKECSRAEEIIEWLKSTYPYVDVDIFDIGETHGKLLATVLGKRNAVPENRLMSTPVFFAEDEFILSENISRKKLVEVVEKYAHAGARAFWRDMSNEELNRAEGTVIEIFRSFTFFAVVLAGLGDGINPCAFATILFFVSYLGMIGRKRKEILIVGLTFALAVFLTYFLVGLGFFKVIEQMSHIELVSKIIFVGTAILCILFGFLSIYDYFQARSGKISDMKLQLPAFLKKRIHSTIRDKVRMKSFVAGALAIGFIVSLLELACTGQVYLPTIVFMVGKEGYNLRAMMYLLLYNICFITPLLIVFGVVYFGVSSRAIATLMEARVGMVKLVLATVFFAIAGLLLWTVL